MIEVVWEFVVKRGAERAFERHYGPRGDWARLFGRHRGYRGTTLLRDTRRPRRFVTVDRWASASDLRAMKRAASAEYAALDAALAALTESETEVGVFVSLPRPR